LSSCSVFLLFLPEETLALPWEVLETQHIKPFLYKDICNFRNKEAMENRIISGKLREGQSPRKQFGLKAYHLINMG
jgi:hypothetical protein